MAQSPIRLSIEVSAGQATVTGIEQLAQRIAADIGGAANQMGAVFTAQIDRVVQQFQKIGNAAVAGFGQAFAQINQQFAATNAMLAQIEQRMSRLRGGGGGGRGGGAGAGAGGGGGGIDLNALLQNLMPGFAPTGRDSVTGTRRSISELVEYANASGRRLTATTNQAGELTRVALGLQPKPGPNPQDRLSQMLMRIRLSAEGRNEAERRRAEEAYRAQVEREAISARSASVSKWADFFTGQYAPQVDAYNRNQANLQQQAVINTRLGAQEWAARMAAEDAARRRAGAVSSAHAMLLSRGYQQVGARTQGGPDGTQTIGIFRNAEGAIARINYETGKWSANLETAKSRWSGIVSALDAGWNRITAISASLAGWIYLLPKIGGILRSTLVDPFISFTRNVIDASETLREFEITAAGVAGGRPRAREITMELVRLSRTSPLSAQETLDASRSASFTPGLAGRFAFGTPQSGAQAYFDYATLLSRAAVFDKEQGERGVAIALRELLSGNAQSLRRRLEINPQALADVSGYRLSEILSNPRFALEAFTKFTDTYVGQEAFQGQRELFSNAIKKLTDAMFQAFATIGDSGAYDQIVDRLRGFTDQIMEAFDPMQNPKFKEQATRISNAIVGILDNAYDTVAGFISRVTGRTDPIRSLSEVVTVLFEATEKATRYLPLVAEVIGDFISNLIDAARDLSLFIKDPLGYAGKRAWMNASITAFSMASSAFGMSQPASGPASGPGTASAGISQIAPAPLPFTTRAADLAERLAAERRVRDFFNEQMSSISGAGIIELTKPLTQATGDFDYRSPFTRMLERQMSVPQQIDELLRPSEMGYPEMLRAAERDLELARRAGGAVIGGQHAISLMTGARGDRQAYKFFNDMQANAEKNMKAVQDLPNLLVRGLQDLAGSMADQLRNMPPTVAVQLGRSIQQDVAGLADQISTTLKLPPDLADKLRNAVRDGPEELQRFIRNAMFDARLRVIGAGMPEALPASAKELLNTAFLTPDQQAEQTKIAREQRQDELMAAYNRASAAFQANPQDREAIDLAFAAEDLRENQRQLIELERQLDRTRQAYEQFAVDVRGALESNIGTAIGNLIKGTGSMRDVMTGFINDIINAFSQMASRSLLYQFMGNFGMPGMGPGGQGPGLLGGMLGNIVQPFFPGVVGAASGAVFPGHFYPMAAFADGGVVNRPTLGLIGEGGSPEAVIPMPSGRVPVELRGGGDKPELKVVVVANYDQALEERADYIVDAVTGAAMNPGSKLNKVLRTNNG